MKRLRTEGPLVSPDEALELMIHHLDMAQNMFEMLNDSLETRIEMMRLVDEKELHADPIAEWYAAIYKKYEDMKAID